MNLKKTLSMSACVILSGMSLCITTFAGKTESVADDYEDYNGYQCTAFARALESTLPKNLGTWQAKLNLINDAEHGRSVDECPESGWIAIVDTRSSQPEGQRVGHVGYVEDADEEDGTITVVTLDGNWKSGKVYRRKGTPAELKIKGYWAP